MKVVCTCDTQGKHALKLELLSTTVFWAASTNSPRPDALPKLALVLLPAKLVALGIQGKGVENLFVCLERLGP